MTYKIYEEVGELLPFSDEFDEQLQSQVATGLKTSKEETSDPLWMMVRVPLKEEF